MIAKESRLFEALLCFFWRCASLQEKVPGDVCMIVRVLTVLFCRIDAKPCSFRFAGKKMAEKTADSLNFCAECCSPCVIRSLTLDVC